MGPRVSQAGSLHSLFGAPELLSGNTFGDIATAALGPEPGTEPDHERLDASLHLGAEKVTEFGLLEVAPEAIVGTVGSLGTPVSYAAGVYNPITIGETAVTIGETAAGAAAVSAGTLLFGAKLGLDGLVFLEAEVVCAVR